MKRLVLLALLASACHIGDVTFTPIGGGDDDPSDARDGSMTDALPPVTQTRGFAAAGGGGLFVLNKAANGELTPAQPTPYTVGNGQAMAVATNRTGTHVYVGVDGPTIFEVRDFVFSGTTLVSNTQQSLPCQPRNIVVHPSQTHLIVTCSQPQVVLFQLDPNGGIAGTGIQLPQVGGNGGKYPAITSNGTCLFLADPQSGAMRITGLAFDGAGYPAAGSSIPGPTGTVELVAHPNSNFLYMVTTQIVQAYAIQGNCTLTPIGSGTAPGMSNPIGAQVDPLGARFYVVGDRVSVFTIEGDGQLTPILSATGLSGTHLRGTFDPSLPNTLYTTSASFNGVFQATYNPANGTLAMGQGFTSAGYAFTDFAFAP